MLHAAIRWCTAMCAIAMAIALGIMALPGTAQAMPDPAPAVLTPAPKNPPPVGLDGGDRAPDRRAVPPKDRPPLTSSTKDGRSAERASIAADCSIADFTSLTGAALVSKIKSSTTGCINGLFSANGTDANRLFRESQMITVSAAYRDNAVAYPGDNSTSTQQLVLYLRAGWFVHFYQPDAVGPYGPSLTSTNRAALDAFFANPRSLTVSDANGAVLAESVILIDSSEEQGRYLYVVKRILNAYNSSWDASYWMKAAANNVYTPLFRGHFNPAFLPAVEADPSVLDTLRQFGINHLDLLGKDHWYLTSNAGRELSRFLQHASLSAKARPLVRDLANRSSLTGPSAPLWVGIAEMVDSYDKANCAYYGTCDLQNRINAEVLPITYTCSASIRIRAQQMTSTELGTSCTSLRNQDAYFHGLVRDSGPVANDRNTTLEVVVFDSSRDYKTYAGPLFGIDTNNGGMYLEGDPAAAGNQPRFIAHEAEWLRPAFEIWNLNHEYTHYLDGRFDMFGDFEANITTPTIWWIEGAAEYVSYHYRNITYTAAITEAGRRTYSLRTLFDTTYSHDTTRVYRWGYLAVRYMFQFHRSDVDTLLGYYRTGNWNAARSFLTGTIGTRYDADWFSWLSRCAAGDCNGGGGGGGTECTGSDTRALGQNCTRSNRGTTAGNYDHLYIYLPAGVSTLRLTSSGGTGNCDLLYNAATWATLTSATHRSTNPGNSESLTISAPAAGYRYVSLYGQTACSGVTITSQY